MPLYSIQGPDGRTYSIEGPPGATREQVIQAIQARMQDAPQTVTAPPVPQPEQSGFFRQILDVPVQVSRGMVGGIRMLADVFGAGSSASEALKSADTWLADLLSAQAKNDQRQVAQILKDAEDKGVLDQVKAGFQAFLTAPVDTLSQALGSTAPVLIAGLASGPVGALLGTARVGAVAMPAIGAAMGVGEVKGSIYESVKEAYKQKGASDEVAEAKAQEAQAYSSANLPSMAVAGGLGALAGGMGIEKPLAGMLSKRAASEAAELQALREAERGFASRVGLGAFREGAPEFAQAGQSKLAENIALRNEGFDVPLFQGVFGAAAMEGAAGAILGGGLSAPRPAGNLLPGQKVGESDAAFARRLSREIDAARQREQIANPLAQPIAEPTAPTVVPTEAAGEDLYRLPDGTAGTLEQAKAYAMSVPPEQRMAVLQQIQASKITKEQAAPEDLFTQPAGDKPAEEVKPTEELKPAEEKPEEKPVESAQAVTKEEEEAAQDALQAEKKPEQAAVSGLPIIEAPLSELILSKDVPQFKSDADAKGVVEPLGGTFDRRGVAPIQVWKRNDGRMEVISGRHRLDLARRSGETTIPAQIHEEATGFDAKQAAMLDAELNIRDQQGKVKDYVSYFENAGISEADAESRGLLARAPGKQGFAIATRGSPELVAAHRADVIPDAGAAAIANAAPGDSRLQAVGIKAIQEGKSPLAAVNLIKAVQTISKDQPPSDGGDLFGFDDSAMREAEDMAKIATLKQNQIAQRLAAISGASRRPEIAKREGIDIKDPEALKKREKELRQQKAAWDNWTSSSDLVEEIRKEMAPTEKASVRETPEPKKVSPELQAKIDLLGKALTRIMSRYGLKDVALKLIADMKAEGEYSSRVLSLALDATDPVSALRHESIHAMKELGFFTDQQWKSLERQAKEKWIDQYLKQKDVNRQPLKEGQTSRYDAYMRLYGGDEEAVIEEAIADAFADFDATKAPPGMLQALLKKVRNFFQAIKEAFGAEPDAERIFRKAERGELRGREVAPNVWKETTEEKEQAEAYEDQNGILPYTSAGQIDVPVETPKASIKAPYKERELTKGKENHPILGVPLNANGTVTLYFPTNNASAREVAKTKRLKAVNPTANRIYLTNESNPAAVRGRLGNIDQGPVEANVMVHVRPELLQFDMEHADGRKDFFIQLAEGNAFAEKMKMTKLFTLYKPRSEAVTKTTTISDIGKGLESGIDAYRKMSPEQRRARLAQARQVLKEEHNVGTLLGENGKLQKTRLNEYQLPEDIENSVASLGLGLASAQKINERNLSTCPNSARCESLCLGETSGQNELYGGEGPFRAGPRLSQYLKTEALVMHPEDFGIVLYEEIKRFEAWAKSDKGFETVTDEKGKKSRVKKQVYTPAIRLNVTSDFPPKMLSPLINGFPDVRFYDYTKLATPGPIADNHHLTYSSDGVAQVVEGKTVGLGSNWNAMIKRLNNGFNVAMAFTSKKDMPDFLLDEKTGEKFQVWNGDNYDARFLDPRPGQKENLFNKGMIIGLTNKDRTGRPEDAAIRYDGFFVDYDRQRDGDTVIIRDQEKIKQGKKVIPIAKPSLRAPQTEAFKRWFGDSKVVDENGEPLVVYHGTSEDIQEFDLGRSQMPLDEQGIYFTTSPVYAGSGYADRIGGNVVPVYLKAKRLYEVTDAQWQRAEGMTPREARARGYDAYVVRGMEGGDTYIVFEPTQIKSATGNVGTFDPTKPDIRYSLRNAAWTDDRVKSLLNQYSYTSTGREKDAKAYAAYIRPEDFLNATATKEYRKQLESEKEPLDAEKLASESQEIYLEIKEDEDGVYQIVGHEGRHRMMALQDAGVSAVPVTLVMRPYGAVKNAEIVEEPYFKPQVFEGKKAVKGFSAMEMIPISWDQRENLKDTFGGEGKVKFSLREGPRLNLRDATDPATRARIDQTTTPREEKTFIQRITEAIFPKSVSHFRAAFLNRYNRLGEYDKELVRQMGGAPLLADSSAEAAALMSDMSAGVLAAAMGVHDRVGGIPVYINGRTEVVNNNNTVKGPLAIFAPLAKYNDPFIYQKYQFWAAVNRGLRLYGQGRDPKFITPADQAEAAKILQDHPEFDGIQKEWIEFNNGLVKYLLDTGVLTEDAAKEFVKYSDYIPFYRQIDGEQTVGPQIFASLAGVKPPKKTKGSEAPLGEFLETVIRNVQYSIEAGMKNAAAQKAVNVAQAINQVQRLNYVSSAPNVVKILEKGKATYYSSQDPLFIDALKSLNLGDLPFIGLLSAPANLLRSLVTKDPAFMLANMMRDSMSAWVSSGVNMTPVVDTLTNFGKALRGQNPEYAALLNSGVIGGYDYSQGVDINASRFNRELRKEAKVYTTTERLTRPFTSLWDALEKGTTASDAATRMEIYKKTLAETGNETEAIFRALEVMNFNRKGSNPLVRVLTAAVPFLNARMQGLDVLYRAAFAKGSDIDPKEVQKRFFVRGMTIAALSSMYWMLASDDDEWKRQEQETRDNYWLIPSLKVKIPIPFEIGVLFKVIPERILEYSFGDDTGKDFMKSMTRQLMSTLAFNPIPQTALPIIEYATNFSFFTTRPIVSQGLEDVAPAYQVGPTTSRLSQLIGGATKDLPTGIQISPVKLDQLINGYTGTIGGYMVDLFDAIYDMNSDAPKAAKRFEQMPVIKRFLVDPQARGQVTAFYELKNSVDEAVRTVNLLERNMQPQEWGEYFQENKGLFAVKDYVLDLEKSMKQYREMKNFVRASSMDADQKKDIILNITTLENQLVSNIQQIKKMSSGQ